MRTAILLLALLPPPGLAGDQMVVIHGAGSNDCGAYLEHRKSEALSAQYAAYVTGFVSGYNFFANQKQIARNLPNATITAFLDKYCRENPLALVNGGALSLISELGGWVHGTTQPSQK